MKFYKKSLIVGLLFILFGIGFLGLSSNVKAHPLDLNYEFEKLVMYNTTDPDYYQDFNTRNATEYTGNYNATYTFENEVGLSGLDNSFIDYTDHDDTCTDIIIASEVGHSEVLNLIDNELIGAKAEIRSIVNPSFSSGRIEYWVYPFSSNGGRLFLQLLNSTLDRTLQLEMADDNKYDVLRAGGTDSNLGSWVNNAWIHISIDYDNIIPSSTIYINGISLGIFTPINSDPIYAIAFVTRVTGIFNVSIDAIGYSWDDDYTIGDNLIPLTTIENTIKEVNRYEFAFEGFQDQYEVGEDVFSNWTEIDDGDDQVNIAEDPLFNSDRRINMSHYAPLTQDLGIEKEFYITSGMLNITWTANFSVWDAGSEYRCKIYSSDDTLISQIYLKDGELFDNFERLDDGLTTNIRYEFNLYINYNDNISILDYYADGVRVDTYILPLIASGKDGLGKIEIYVDASAINDMDVFLDYVGVYVNGTSITEEFGYRTMRYILFDDYWKLKVHNLFNFNAIGNLSFYVSKYAYVPFISTIAQICPLDYYNASETFNMYDNDDFGIYDQIYVPMLWVQFYNQLEKIESVSIEGARMTEGSNVYELFFYHDNVDISESFFYVDNNNRLRFNFIADDNDTEYIEALFLIYFKPTENRTVSFSSNINGYSSGMLRFYWWGFSNPTDIYFPYYAKTTTLLLPQNKFIFRMSIVIIDFNETYYDICEGYISNLKLLYTPQGAPSVKLIPIDISALIAILIPLIILLAPTFAISVKFGKKAILPMFVLMSLICVATNLIPVWLFFIIAISTGALMLQQFRSGDKE